MGRKYLPVQADWFVELQRRSGGRQRRLVPDSAMALPDDAHVVQMGHDRFGKMNLILESAEWPKVEEGALYPECPSPILNVVYEGQKSGGPCKTCRCQIVPDKSHPLCGKVSSSAQVVYCSELGGGCWAWEASEVP